VEQVLVVVTGRNFRSYDLEWETRKTTSKKGVSPNSDVVAEYAFAN